MNKPYVVIGIQLYKKMCLLDSRGHRYNTLKPWNEDTIRKELRKLEFSKSEIDKYLCDIPIYDHHIYMPDHINYKQVVNNQYNLYQELVFKPKKGDFPNTMILLKHIFGRQLEISLDYLQLIYLKPLQILPILVLVSSIRGTGKTTFFNWLKLIFSSNMILQEADNLKSRFNSELEGKIISAIEDTEYLRHQSIIDKIKNYSTAISYQSEAKGCNRTEVSLFVKFIISSNNEEDLLKLDSEEIRFWVVKVRAIAEENLDTDILNKLELEVPAFLYFLKHRKLSIPKAKSRMWFAPKDIRTENLDIMIRNNLEISERELAILLYEIMDDSDLNSVDLRPIDAVELLKSIKINVDTPKMRNILKDRWKLKCKDNSFNYEKPEPIRGGNYIFTRSKGKFFTVTKDFLLNKFGDLVTGQDNYLYNS